MILLLSSLLFLTFAQESSCKVDEERAAQLMETMNAWKKHCQLPTKNRAQMPQENDIFAERPLTEATLHRFYQNARQTLAATHRHNYLVAMSRSKCTKYKEELDKVQVHFRSAYRTSCTGFLELDTEIQKTDLYLNKTILLTEQTLEKNAEMSREFSRLDKLVEDYIKVYPPLRSTASQRPQ